MIFLDKKDTCNLFIGCTDVNMWQFVVATREQCRVSGRQSIEWDFFFKEKKTWLEN
jgi:hypothetical protein